MHPPPTDAELLDRAFYRMHLLTWELFYYAHGPGYGPYLERYWQTREFSPEVRAYCLEHCEAHAA